MQVSFYQGNAEGEEKGVEAAWKEEQKLFIKKLSQVFQRFGCSQSHLLVPW